MNAVISVIAHTPLWAWPLIVIVLVMGVRNLSTRKRSMPPLFILPAILLTFAVANLLSSRADAVLVVPAFLFSVACGLGVGWGLVPRQAAALKDRGLLHVPGSAAPLLVSIAAIALRYAIGYIYGRWPEMRADPALALEFSATGALLAGIVWGRVLRLTLIYRRA